MGFENLSGRTFGQYELRDLMGVGGMGAVYRAYQSGLDREVAVKVLPRALAAETGYIERFIREARTAALLEHPHIVRIYDYGTQGDISYLVMALLRGGSLSQRLSQREEISRPRASLGEVASMLNQIASALDYAHHEGVLHRDIKPANIMFDNQGRAYVTDFGIAKLMGATTALTGTGVAMGSPSYMPPEQWAGQDLSPAADQYALGVTIYQTIASRLPFEADSAAQLMYKHFHEEPTPLSVSRSDIPTSLMLVLNRSMAKAPEQRFPNLTQFAQAFESAIEGSTGDATNFFLYKLKSDRPRPSSATGSPSLAEIPRTPSNTGAPAPVSGGYMPPTQPPAGGYTPPHSGGYTPPTQPGQPPQNAYAPQSGYTPQGAYPPGMYQPGSTPSGTYTAAYIQPPRPFYRSPVAIIGGLVAVIGVAIIALLALRPPDNSTESVFSTLTAVAQSQLGTAQQMTIVAALATDTPSIEPSQTVTPTNTESQVASLEPSATITTEATTLIVILPSDTSQPTETPEETAAPSATFTTTDEPTFTPTNTLTETATTGPTETATPTATATQTLTATDTPSETPEPTATNTTAFTPSHTFTPRPTRTPSLTPTYTAEPITAAELTLGEAVSGSIDDETPSIRYSFEGTAGQVVTLTVSVVVGNLDPSLILVGPSGAELISNDDVSGIDRNAAISEFTLPQDGTYTVIVLRFRGPRGRSQGSFVLNVSDAQSPQASGLVLGEPVEGTISNVIPSVTYAFEAEAGSTISVAIYATSGNLDTILELYGPDGQLILDNDDAEGGTTNSAIDEYVTEVSGQFTVVASRFRGEAGNTAGDFVITLTEGSPAGPPDSLAVSELVAGEPVLGLIDGTHPQRVYSYVGVAGEQVSVSLVATEGSLDPLVRIVRPDGTTLAENDDQAFGEGNSLIAMTVLPVDGVYSIIATRFRESSGDTEGRFELLVTRGTGVTSLVECGDVLTLGCTATVSATIDRPVNVRSEPRASGAVLTSISAGTVVTLLDGPRAAEGFIWWQVQLSDSTQGWMVQRIGFNDVLLPSTQ